MKTGSLKYLIRISELTIKFSTEVLRLRFKNLKLMNKYCGFCTFLFSNFSVYFTVSSFHKFTIFASIGVGY